MPAAAARPTAPRKRQRKRKRRAAFSSSSSSSSSSSDSDSESEKEAKPKPPTKSIPPPKAIPETADSSSESSSSSSSSSSESSSDVESENEDAAVPAAEPTHTEPNGPKPPRHFSPSPSPPPAQLPPFLNPGDEVHEKAMKEKFRKFWMASIADGFKDDLEEIRKVPWVRFLRYNKFTTTLPQEPNLSTSRLALLIDSLATGADVFTSSQKQGVNDIDVILE
jgi:ribosome assembly protein 3